MKSKVMSLRRMGFMALIYHLMLLILLILAFSVSWQHFIFVISVTFFAWMGGGQLAAWVYDPRQEFEYNE